MVHTSFWFMPMILIYWEEVYICRQSIKKLSL